MVDDKITLVVYNPSVSNKRFQLPNTKLVIEILELLESSFEENEQLMFPDGGYHISVAVLDLLRIAVANKVIENGGDRFLDVLYKIRGCKVVNKSFEETEKLDKTHSDIIYGEKQE
jgi:hypothetical protein